MIKKIILRADGNSIVGLGHLFRSFALIEMFKDEYECVFLTRQDSLNDIIPKEYRIDIIPKNISYSEEPHWISKKYNYNEFIVIADGYAFDSNYQRDFKKFGFKFIYIDDLASSGMFADIVINHSLNLSVKDFTAAAEYTKFALGTEYAVMRPKFIKAAKKVKEIKKIDEVFICFGGVDFYDFTNRALEGVIEIPSIKKINIVISSAYSHEDIYSTLKKRKKDVFIYKNICENKMIELMNKCQLAIIPSSTISYEACSVKMLILGGYYVDNQKRINEGLDLNGMIYNVGDFRELKAEDFKQKVLEITKENNLSYEKMIKNQSKMFDGKQKDRFNKLIESIC